MKDQFSVVVGKVNSTIYLRVSKAKKDELGIIARQTGFIEMDSVDNANALLAKLESGELSAQFTGQRNQQGNFEVKVLASAGVTELEHA